MDYHSKYNDRSRSLLILVLVLFVSCEDVIQVDTPSEEPRLIIDAIIGVDVSENVTPLAVKASLTSPFFGTTPLTNLKQITLSNLDGISVILKEFTPGSGVYEEFVGPSYLAGGEIIFQVEHEDQRYLARTNFVPIPPIDTLIQVSQPGSENGVEVAAAFNDVGGRRDYYLFDMGNGELFTINDTFFDGERHQFIYRYEREILAGDSLEVLVYGIDQQFHNYINQLISQSQDSPSPFDTPVATLIGNIINVTKIDNLDSFDNVQSPENFILGYFAIAETHRKSIVIQ
ncbi:MAG: DUF4249 family protein [Cyclobacteriaceae bacterium]